jgi:hypothetical protein
MKTITNKLGAFVGIAAIMIVALACGSSTPPPPAYVGVWTGADGALITIRADGGADYKSGGTSVTGGSVTIDEAAKTMKIGLAGLGPTFKIDKAPTGNEMTLDGNVFKTSGGGSTSTTSSNSSSTSSSSKSEVPSNDKLQTLVKSTLMDFGDAIQNEDFTEFHKKAAKVWRDSSTPEEMDKAFAVFVDNKESYDFKKAVSSLDATFTPAPAIEQVSGLEALVVKGNYPTKPEATNFELKYTQEDGNWKLIGINVKTSK